MRHNNELPRLEELLDRSDLSHVEKMDLVQRHAEAKRAEYIADCLESLAARIKAVFTAENPLMGSPVRHA